MTGATSFSATIFWQSRLPRLLAVLLAGAGIAVCGLIMQRVSQNPFVSPDTAGTTDAAGLGFVLALLLLPGTPVVVRIAFSFAVALAGSLIFFFFVSRYRTGGVVFVPLMGLIIGAIIGGITQMIAFRTDLLQVLNTWLFADFSLIVIGRYELVFLIVPAVAIAYAYAHHVTIAGMGRDTATSLGVRYQRTILVSLAVVSLVSAVVVVTAGRIPFLGLVVPNLVSWKISDNVRAVLPLTALAGGALLIASDLASRLILAPFEMPVGLTMGIVGSVFFLIVLNRRNAHE